MVFFSCEGCNETLKKNQVENHLRRCHCPVSCVDCSQVFPGLTYQAHTSCISEAEKYEKSLYRGPKQGAKGKNQKRNPQEEWMELIATAAGEAGGNGGGGGAGGGKLSPFLKAQLPRMADLGNVPRNEKKFKNFVSNSLRIHRVQDQDELWQFLRGRLEANKAQEEEKKAAMTAGKMEEQQQQEAPATPVAVEEGKKEKKEKKEKKRKNDGEQEETESADNNNTSNKKQEPAAAQEEASSFPWAETIQKLVKKAEGKQMEKKTLQKAVLALATEQEEGEKKQLKKQFKAALEAGMPKIVVREEDGMVVYKKK